MVNNGLMVVSGREKDSWLLVVRLMIVGGSIIHDFISKLDHSYT